MLNRKGAILLAAAFLFSVPAVAQSPAPAPAPAAAATALPDADPAIWVVKDPDTTIYLFGTFHALDGKSDWFNEEVKTAFDQSSEV
ncbi:MAG TPA: TraB/GumN family protein, partial [Sphingomicrobium sp.]|nr:TraB/GumN family protein [Sphingomicrobium sp.]